jgi:creatinine amidohydrolase/Fe(II)-dependent formamide hydrolase-like protein
MKNENKKTLKFEMTESQFATVAEALKRAQVSYHTSADKSVVLNNHIGEVASLAIVQQLMSDQAWNQTKFS